ncbi:MAG: CbiX/SirB N-terminal domain-containing protein [Methylibium sp.]|uniref:sirohydrochlorin chelatase n=1 Tax=Methylibium sp. TaxID=2067992 RepID=UPI0018230271|nr:CbiX/SirB N-terminal domain-containing protein [Methylibium sp.]MBA3597617.1 CbiX/SirB N-terminal domain-containing protein [Methylibium sp.]
MNGVLLFAHGARDPLWARPFEAVAQALRAREPEMPVALGFLEFMTPDLRGAGDTLAARGCGKVSVVPLFLGAGGHVRKDLPLLLDALRAAHPHIEWQLAPAVGEDATVVAAMAEVAWRHARS